MVQAVSRLVLTAKDRVQCQTSTWGIYGIQCGSGTGFSPGTSGFS